MPCTIDHLFNQSYDSPEPFPEIFLVIILNIFGDHT